MIFLTNKDEGQIAQDYFLNNWLQKYNLLGSVPDETSL